MGVVLDSRRGQGQTRDEVGHRLPVSPIEVLLQVEFIVRLSLRSTGCVEYGTGGVVKTVHGNWVKNHNRSPPSSLTARVTVNHAFDWVQPAPLGCVADWHRRNPTRPNQLRSTDKAVRRELLSPFASRPEPTAPRSSSWTEPR